MTIGGVPLKVKVRLFAQQREQVGWTEREVEVPEGSKVTDLIAALGREYPAIASAARHLVAAVNAEYVEPSAVLHAGDEVALIPPVSGGARLLTASHFPLMVSLPNHG